MFYSETAALALCALDFPGVVVGAIVEAHGKGYASFVFVQQRYGIHTA
jgi:hypothetical protein